MTGTSSATRACRLALAGLVLLLPGCATYRLDPPSTVHPASPGAPTAPQRPKPRPEPTQDDPQFARAGLVEPRPPSGVDALQRPTDPVRARLLPDAVLDDADAAADFRRLNETALLDRKRSDAAALRGALDSEVVVDATGARQLLGALNDLRLMLGTRLAVTEEGVLAGAEDLHAYTTYQLLTYLQGDLVDVLTQSAP